MARSAANKIDLSFYQNQFQASPNGIAIYDPSLKCILINKAGCEVLHVTEKEAIGKKMEDLAPGIKKTERYKKYQETLKTGKPFSLYFSREHNKKNQHLRVKTVKIGENLALYVEDVTELEENAAKVEERKSELESLLFSINSPVFFKDCDLNFTYVNKACADFFDTSAEEMIGKTAMDFFPKDTADYVTEQEKKVISGELAIISDEAPLVDGKGQIHWQATTIVPLKNKKKGISGLVGVAFDVTKRKITETELELLATAIHQTSETIVITDTEGNIQYVNPAFEETSGYSAEEVIGKNPSVLQSGKHDDGFYQDLWNTINKGESWSGHFFNKKKDGSSYEEEADISPVFGPDRAITNFVAVKRDVTKEVTLETQLRQSQKMEAIGRLAGGVAHDFNNILTAILGYSELILATMEETDPVYRKVEEIRKAGKRASSLTKQMLAFSRKQVVQHRLLNLNDAITDMVDMLKRIIGENVKLELKLDKNLDYVMSDTGQIEQIIMNLAVNSKDAIPSIGGELTIETGNVFLNNGFNDGNFDVPPGSYVMILVKDNGCGIGEETIKHIFEPFFSKKVDAIGTGLGLSTVYGIVKQHNGCITVDSKEGKGAAFKILIPAAPEEAISAEEETTSGKGFRSGSGVVLVVEDERPVLDLAESILKLAGYSVLTASSAEDALEIFHKLDDEIDLLITDIVLSGMTGDKLAAEIRKTAPDLRVLFMSGYAGEAVSSLDLDCPDNDFLEKPFSMEKLSGKVRELLSLKR